MKFYTIPSNEIGEAKSKTTHYFFDMKFFDEIKLWIPTVTLFKY